MLKKSIKKIVAIGPESTGKSTLCKQLAQHYNTAWCPEFAREYLLTHGTDYDYEDLLIIAKGQVALEEEYLRSMVNGERSTGATPPARHHSPLFIDTDMYVMKVWSEFVFDNCHRFILDTIVEREYDLYLLCNTDLPWTKDELREYPDLATRQKLYRIFKDLMINQAVPWVDIRGSVEERFQKAISAVNKIL